MATFSRVAYSGLEGEADAARPVLFSRTDFFGFSSGAQKLEIGSALLGPQGLRFSLVRSTGHECGLGEADNLTVLLPTRGLLEVAAGEQRLAADPGSALVYGPNTRRTRVIPDLAGWYEALVLLVPAASLAALDPEGRFKLPAGDANGIAMASDHELASLRRMLDFIRADFASPAPLLARPETAQALELTLAEMLKGLLFRHRPDDTAATGAPPAAARKVREADEYIRANFARPLSVADIAGAVGAGVRSLQLAYRSARGMSPREALSEVRIAEARRRLQHGQPGTSVTEIALACGFADLSRFGAAYRARYGERPSETLQRATGAKAAPRG